jgi:hypothetical protein
VQRERGNILVKGEDAAKTIIAFDLNANLPGPEGKPIGTFRTPTVQIDGDGMVWENLTLANTAGPVGQALALRADGDRLVFRGVAFSAGRTRSSSIEAGIYSRIVTSRGTWISFLVRPRPIFCAATFTVCATATSRQHPRLRG